MLEKLLNDNVPPARIIGRYINGVINLTPKELTKVIKLKNQKKKRKKDLQKKKNSV